MQPLKLHPSAGPGQALAETQAPAKPAAPLLLSAADLAQLLRVSTATIWRLRAAGRLPRPSTALGKQLVRWDAAEVRRWVAAGMPELRTWEALEAQRNGRPR